MSDEYAFDLYPRSDPRDGTRLARYTYEDLIAAEYRDVIGVGSGQATLWVDHDGAEHIDSGGEQYIRVVRLGAPSEVVVGGIWTSKLPFETAVASERRHLSVQGPGQMAYLARARMAPRSYLNNVLPTFIPQDPFDGMWRLGNQGLAAGGDKLGAMLWRVVTEAMSFRSGTYTHKHSTDDEFGEVFTDNHTNDRTATKLGDLVLGFDQFEDSDGTAWTLTAGDFSAQIGESVLGVVQRLMQAGLFVWMDPDTFTLYAWEGRPATKLGRSTDRTGGAWASNVVRFQSPTDGTVDTGNILSDVNRVVNAHLPQGPIWVGGNDVVHKETGTAGALYEGFVHSDAEDETAFASIGAAQKTAREEASDVGLVPHRGGNAPSNGAYRPGEHYLVDELVTIHTGSGELDYNEASYPVGAWRVSLAPGAAEWQAFVELGASFDEARERQFSIPATPGHTHPPNPQLCRPAAIGDEFAWVDSLSSHETGDTTQTTGVVVGPTVVNTITLNFGKTVPAGHAVVVVIGHNHNADPVYGVYDDEGNTWVEAAVHRKAISGDQPKGWIYYANITEPTDHVKFEVGDAAGSDVRTIAAEEFRGSISSAAESGATSGFDDTPAVTVGAADLQVALLVTKAGEADTITEDADWTPFEPAGTPSTWMRAGWRLNDASSEAWNGTIDQDRDWMMVGATFVTSVTGGAVNDGHLDLVGHSQRAARCDHRHDVHRTSAPTVNDDWATAGYKLGTIWAQLDDLDDPTEIVGTWMLVDASTGAAVWLEMGGVSDHGALSGLADDDHPQYALDTDLTAHAATTHGGGIGPILITSEPAGSPLVFDDLLQNSEGTDLLYASEP